jgi:sec-independent protein translocase protein TatA
MSFNLLFFNISTGEIFLILLIVFIIFGPGKIPEIAKKLGRALYEVKRASSEIKREINSEINKIERDKIKTKPEEVENTPKESK